MGRGHWGPLRQRSRLNARRCPDRRRRRCSGDCYTGIRAGTLQRWVLGYGSIGRRQPADSRNKLSTRRGAAMLASPIVAASIHDRFSMSGQGVDDPRKLLPVPARLTALLG